MTQPLPDPHFGTDEEMFAWAQRESIQPVRDADGNWDWHAAWDTYLSRLDPARLSDPTT